jgi:catechol 2,3-dioxygenase-like lactoylglutathione lyase family enzyme
MRPAGLALGLMLLAGAARAQDLTNAPAGMVRVRYIVNDVAQSVVFYRDTLGFRVDLPPSPYFAALSRGGVQLLITPVRGPGGASQPMPNGDRPAPGGWTRIVINVPDLKARVDALRAQGVRFRNEIVAGPGGREILLEDPSGNPVELFQPG